MVFSSCSTFPCSFQVGQIAFLRCHIPTDVLTVYNNTVKIVRYRSMEGTVKNFTGDLPPGA
jgi:hypothetical protein